MLGHFEEVISVPMDRVLSFKQLSLLISEETAKRVNALRNP
jgi:hypothetical protein